MSRIFVVSMVVIATGLFISGCATLAGTGSEAAVLRAKDRVAPALVHIKPVKEVFARGKREEVVVVGSGFIISEDGYVVTNEHVAGDSTVVRCVLSDNQEYDAEVVGTDPFTDIAVLKLNNPNNRRFPTVPMGSSAKLEPGQTVLAFGSPHGLSRSVSLGIVSVTDRYLGGQDSERAPYNTWIQTDAAINPGNSGGPLVNLQGEVVGVNARKLSGADNVGFAIPVDVARPVVEEIIEDGRVHRAWLGLSLQETTSKTEDPSQQGVIIASIDPISPAAEAGLRPGDVLLSVEGTPTNARYEEELPSVRNVIASLPVDSSVEVEVARGEDTFVRSVTTVEKSELRGEQVELTDWGFTVSEVTPQVLQRARLSERAGALVSGTQEGGLANQAGLQAGDIVLTVDGAKVKNLSHFVELVEERVESGQERVLMDAKRGALTRFVLLKQQVGAPATGPGA